jgi:hypothetical protein
MPFSFSKSFQFVMATQPTQADVAEMMSAGAVVLEKIPAAAPLSMGRTGVDIDLPAIPPEGIQLPL